MILLAVLLLTSTFSGAASASTMSLPLNALHAPTLLLPVGQAGMAFIKFIVLSTVALGGRVSAMNTELSVTVDSEGVVTGLSAHSKGLPSHSDYDESPIEKDLDELFQSVVPTQATHILSEAKKQARKYLHQLKQAKENELKESDEQDLQITSAEMFDTTQYTASSIKEEIRVLLAKTLQDVKKLVLKLKPPNAYIDFVATAEVKLKTAAHLQAWEYKVDVTDKKIPESETQDAFNLDSSGMSETVSALWPQELRSN